jgi:hypothetical protein
LPSACNLLTLNNELKESACCEFQFQPIRNGNPLKMSEWQITLPWKPYVDKSVTGTAFVRRVKCQFKAVVRLLPNTPANVLQAQHYPPFPAGNITLMSLY